MASSRASLKLFLGSCSGVLFILTALNIYNRQHTSDLMQSGTSRAPMSARRQLDTPAPADPDLIPGVPQSEDIVILNWRHLWDNPGEGLREGRVMEGCHVTYNQSAIGRARAVVFEYTALDHEEMPWKFHRHPDQVFVFRAAESTASMRNWFHFDFAKFDRLRVNWTMTYRRDADVWAPYAKPWHLGAHARGGRDKVDRIVTGKKRKALWVVSNCDGSSGARRRMKFVDEMIESGFKGLDRFGKCFDNKQEFNEMPEEVRASYKFYFAFENSLHCRDYLTEKFWRNALMRGLVPVVWGPTRADMLEIAPRGSYIHAEDFDGPADLARYLDYLDRSDSSYRRYFDWMIDYHQNQDGGGALQRIEYVEEHLLCDRLRRGGFPRKTIESLDQFWYGRENDECFEE